MIIEVTMRQNIVYRVKNPTFSESGISGRYYFIENEDFISQETEYSKVDGLFPFKENASSRNWFVTNYKVL